MVVHKNKVEMESSYMAMEDLIGTVVELSENVT